MLSPFSFSVNICRFLSQSSSIPVRFIKDMKLGANHILAIRNLFSCHLQPSDLECWVSEFGCDRWHHSREWGAHWCTAALSCSWQQLSKVDTTSTSCRMVPLLLQAVCVSATVFQLCPWNVVWTGPHVCCDYMLECWAGKKEAILSD